MLLPSISLRLKLWLGLGGLIFILLIVSAISAVVLTHFGHELERLLRENYDSAVYCEEMADSLDHIDASVRQLAWGEAGPAVDVAAQQARFEANLHKQIANVSLPGEEEETDRLKTLWTTYSRAYAYFQTAPPAERRQLYINSLGPTFRNARASARKIVALNLDNIVSADGRVRANTLQVRNALLVLVGAGAALAIVIFATAGATVLGPLRDLTHSAQRVGAGELDLNVPVRSKDEVGQLAAAFNVMAERLREYRKIDHQRLVRAQTTTQLAIDSLPDGVVVTSPQGVIEICNQTAMTHFHAEPGRNIANLGLDWLLAIHRDALAGKQVELRGYASAVQLFQNGEERFLLPHGVPMRHDADVVGVAIILVDVTRLRQADEFKSGLVSTVSHELRTPLTAIRMSTIMLAEETLGGLNPSQKRLIDAARDESERLYRIIENLLNFSRAQAGSARIRPRSVAAQSLIADALTPLAAAFDERKIRVSVKTDGAPDAWADPALASSVLSNLLSNAVKFTPVGGEVEISARPAGDSLELIVADSGPGVAPEHVGKLFQRFFRAAGPDSPAGTGLGLAISREIALAHGGSLSYQPRTGGGSVFRFTLPTAVGTMAVVR